MRSRLERILRTLAAFSTAVALVAIGLAVTGRTAAAWAAMAGVYATGVSYGLAEMRRLYDTHRRRCRECLAGTGRHVRWWAPRVVLVMVVSLLPVLLLLPLLGEAAA